MADFRDAIRAAGLEPPPQIVPGKFYRFPGRNKGQSNKAGWCKLFSDELGGVFGDFSADLNETWRAENNGLRTEVDKKAFRSQVKEARAEAETERKHSQNEAARRARDIWGESKPADPDHAYLAKKGVRPHDLREARNGRLIVPMRDGQEIRSLQFIGPDGAKRFLEGGQTKGCFHILGNPDGADTLCVAEGFSTAATIREATGCPVAVAFNAGNLKPVARAMRGCFLGVRLVVCADDDQETDGNPGVTKAYEAARAEGALVAVPDFGAERDGSETDFNDMENKLGAEAVRQNIENAKLPPDNEAPASGLPEIKVNGRRLRDITADAEDVIRAECARDPDLFALGKAWVQVSESKTEAAHLSQDKLKSWLDRHADFTSYDKDGNPKPARPPGDVVKDLLALPDPPLPRLSGIARAPVFLSGGRLLASEGYDPESRLLMRLGDLGGVKGDMDPRSARELLLEDLLEDFPFTAEVDKAHAVALLLERFVRPLVGGLAPLHLIEAPVRGSGKGLLVSVASLVALGDDARVMYPPRDDDETEKRITAHLMTAPPIVLLDNATVLRSKALAAVLTAGTWEGRLLGESKLIHMPNRTLWVSTANNPELSDEIARRTVSIRLDPQMGRPEDRTDFLHPNLKTWTRQNRRKIVRACLSLVQAWIDAGMPEGRRTLGSFESWAHVMGGIMETAGIEGFLEDRDRLYSGADRESREWADACAAWHAAHEGAPITAGALLGTLKDKELLLDLWAGRSQLGAQQRLGRALSARRDRVHERPAWDFGPEERYRIRSAGRDGSANSNSFRLERLAPRVADKTQETRRDPEGQDKSVGYEPGFRSQNPGETRQNPGETQKPGQNPEQESHENSGSYGFPGFPGFPSGPPEAPAGNAASEGADPTDSANDDTEPPRAPGWRRTL